MQEPRQNAIQNVTQSSYFKPSELLDIFRNFLSNREINASVVCLRGIYIKTKNVYKDVSYDVLKDENSPYEMTIVIPNGFRNELNNGNLISVYGTLDRKVQSTGYIQIILRVTRFDKLKDLEISEEEIKRAECRRFKEAKGYKNVDTVLENQLFMNKRPKVALLFAEKSITDSDFNAGILSAKSHIDFFEYRVSFANSQDLSKMLKYIDSQRYDVITLLRGGGSGLDKLDDIMVANALSNLETPWIYGAGHKDEKLFIRNLADKVIPIPHAAGTYFRDIVDSVIEKRNKSKAVLVEEVRKQFKEQLETGMKQNKELQERLAALTKTQDESIKRYNEQLATANKQNTSLQERLSNIQKSHKEQLETLNSNQVKLQEQLKAQQENFGKNLSKMQDANFQLQKKLTSITDQNASTLKALQLANSKCQELERTLKESATGKNNKLIIALILLCIGLFVALVFK